MPLVCRAAFAERVDESARSSGLGTSGIISYFDIDQPDKVDGAV